MFRNYALSAVANREEAGLRMLRPVADESSSSNSDEDEDERRDQFTFDTGQAILGQLHFHGSNLYF